MKSLVPRPAARLLRAIEQASRRSFTWLEISRHVRGRTPEDQAIVGSSLRDAPRQVFSDLSKWREPNLISDATVTVDGLGTFRVRGRSDDLGHLVPKHSKLLRSIIAKRVKTGDAVVDAGANIGVVSIILANAVGPAGRVVAVEMMPDTASCLRRNIELNHAGNVTVVESALSDAAGQIVRASVRPGLYGQASIANQASQHETVQIEVRTTTLDDVTKDLSAIAFLKMDLEVEHIALAGARETLRRTRAVFFESWSPDGGDAARILCDAGFGLTQVDGRNFLAVRD